MKKQKLNILLASSAVLTGIVTYALVKLTTTPLLQFVPYMIFALVLLVFFSGHIKKYYHGWAASFGSLSVTLLIAVGTMFLLFYQFPASGMNPQAWDATDVVMLISVSAAFAVAIGLVLASLMYIPISGMQNQPMKKVEN